MQEYDYEKRIMGSDASISIVASDVATADMIAKKLMARAEAYEARFSRFKDTSELSKLNRERSMIVSPEFMEVFLIAKELYANTGGVFNVLTDISRFGYDADIKVVQGAERTGHRQDELYNRSLESVVVSSETNTITLQEGQNLDFGGFLKGYVAEKLARSTPECAGIVVNLGGDIFTSGHDADGDSFVFFVDNPLDLERDIPFFVTGKGIATSGSYNRHWNHNGKPFFHILDESGTKNPESDIASITVIAATGSEAEAFATATFIHGLSQGTKILEEKGIEYYCICTDGTVHASTGFPFIEPTSTFSHAA